MFRDMMRDFRAFLLRGNVVDLAVAVVIGAAFTAVVTALVKDIITPLIAAVGGKPNFESLSFKIHNSIFLYGDFINALISFVIMAVVVFFFVVQPINKLIKLANRGKVKDTPKDPEVLLLEEIRDLLKDRKDKK